MSNTNIGKGLCEKSDTVTKKERMWQAWKESWNIKGSTDSMTELETRTARQHFEQWYGQNYE